MGTIKGPDKDGSIEITYGGTECPFTGIDSSAADAYLAPGAITKASYNVLPVNKQLCPIGLSFQSVLTMATGQIFIGTGDLNNRQFALVYDPSGPSLLLYIDTTPASIYPTFTLVVTLPVPLFSVCPTPLAGSLTYKNINSVCYFSFVYSPYLFTHDNNSLNILTNYLGCAYLNELNGRLVAGNIFQIPQAPVTTQNTTTPPTETITAVSTRFNTVTTFGAPLFFPANTVSPSAQVFVQVKFNWNVVNNFPGGSNPNSYYGRCQIQYSLDTGNTWTSIYDYTTAPDINYVSGPVSVAVIPTGVTNTNTIAVRAVVSAAGADLPNIVFTTCNINNTLVQVYNAPIPPVFTAYPFQFAWSGPLQQYSQWNPIASTGFASGAGLNNLPDVEDVITGMIMEGPTGYIIREQGITEVTALSSGIEPFDFNHLWASHLGVGSNYPNATAQYGALGFIVANDDIYTLGYSGINVIAGKAASLIYHTLVDILPTNTIQQVYGVCGLLNIDGDVSPVYIISVFIGATTPFIFIYWQKTGEWYQLEPFNIPLTNFSLWLPAAFNTLTGLRLATSNRIVFMQVTGTTVNQFILTSQSNQIFLSLGTGGNPVVFNTTFKAEEALFLRDVTIDSVVIYLKGLTALDTNILFQATITGISDNIPVTAIDTVSSISIGTYQYIKLYPKQTSGSPFTGAVPQLSLTMTLNSVSARVAPALIAKVVMFGTIDITQRPV